MIPLKIALLRCFDAYPFAPKKYVKDLFEGLYQVHWNESEMSNFAEHVAICQRKLVPPRSLQNADEEGQIVWDIITKRYPKTAPLLCDMEAVIERAEGLAHRLRSISIDNVNILSQIASSTQSSSCSAESSSTSEENYDDAKDRTESMDSEVPSKSSSSQGSVHLEPDKSTAPCSSVNELTNTNNSLDSEAKESSQLNESGNATTSEISNTMNFNNPNRMKEMSCLEEGKEGVGKKIACSTPVSSEKEILSIHYDCAEFPKIRSTVETTSEVTETDFEGPKDSTKTTDLITTTNKTKNTLIEPESLATEVFTKETLFSGKSRIKPTMDKTSGRTEKGISEAVSIRTEIDKMKSNKGIMISNDANNSKNLSEQRPSVMLEDYAKQCNQQVNYKVTPKKKSCIVECSFAGYKVKSIGHPESQVREDVAAKVLRMLASSQMDEKRLKNLEPFSIEQMREIIALGTGGEFEPAIRKLYKLCLQRNAPKPVYSVKQEPGVNGILHTAKCEALNSEGTGCGVCEDRAKQLAAENLYRKLDV